MSKFVLKAYPVLSLDNIIDKKLQELKNNRDENEVAIIQTDKGLFDYDTKSRERIIAAITALEVAGKNAKISWTLADNTEIVVTTKDLKNVISAVAMRSNELHVKYRDFKEVIDNIKQQVDNNKIKIGDAIEQINNLTW